MRLLRPPKRAASAPRRAQPESPPVARDPEPALSDPPLEAERRLRAAGGPEDQATYACRCGAVFPATPTTSVSCPLCGVHQAW